MTILVTGATGNVGGQVLSQLVSRGATTRVLTRRPNHPALAGATDLRRGDLTNPATLAAALDGVTTVFLYAVARSGPLFARAARAAGVRKVVFLSSIAVEEDTSGNNPIELLHAEVEEAVRDAGLGWTFLRPADFAANALAWVPQIRAGGTVGLPYPDAVGTAIHEADIAAVAVTALVEDGHEGRAYPLTGPQALTQADRLAAIGAALGRELRFEKISEDEYRREWQGRIPAGTTDQLLTYWRESVDTSPAVLPTVAEVTNRPARTFAQWARDHAADFGG